MANHPQKPITSFFRITKKRLPPGYRSSSCGGGANNVDCQKDTISEEDNEILKSFDLNWVFGPCSGLSRLDRWERASKLSLNPPYKIKELILKNKNNINYTLCIWDQNALLQPMPVIPEH